MPSTLPVSEALSWESLVTPTQKGIASRVLAKSAGANITLFAFDAAEELSEHTTPYDALVVVLDGAMTLTIGGEPVAAPKNTVVRMPAGVPHAVLAREPSRMLLIMLRDPAP